MRLHVRALRDRSGQGRPLEETVSAVMRCVSDYPRSEEFQKIIARLWQEQGESERAFAAWLGIALRFPASMEAFNALVAFARKRNGPEGAKAIVHARFPRMPKPLDQLLAYAEACDLAGLAAERRTAFTRLGKSFRTRSDPWASATSWLEEDWTLYRWPAVFVRRLAAGTGLGRPILRWQQRLAAVVDDAEAGPAGWRGRGAAAPSVKVLGALFDRVLEQRRQGIPKQEASARGVVLLTGSLGAGGAERQLVNTAAGLAGMSVERRILADGTALDEISVLARSLRDRKDGAFYLSELQGAGVEVQSYRDLPDFAGSLPASAARSALSALGFLPWSTAEAVIKLTDILKSKNPAVVHIWQDGLVYAAGLAALLAGVPRIVLGGRSTPPPDRRAEYLVEYDVIYRSLLRASGVKLTVNSRHAASRYAAWLGVDTASIAVVPNGVVPPPAIADRASEDAFAAFDRATGPASLTLGAVMRLDEVKRPLLWIDVAARVLNRLPHARFILVGDGPLRARVERRAATLGIAGRCLFAGRSSCIGYWLTRMDALMLLSSHEGLPNALIEAQLAGVPVITTPAGGAPETLIPGVTGIVTSADPHVHDIADAIASLAAQPDRLRAMGEAARQWARDAFPMSRMLENTLRLYDSTARHASYPSLQAPRIAEAEPAF